MSSKPDSPISAETVVPALTQAIGHLIRQLRAEANPGGLNLSQTAALAMLEEAGGMTNADLARTQAMKPQSMSTILAGLEEERLVERSPHPTDGRQILFSLTPAGAEARRKRSTAKHEWLLSAVEKLHQAERQTLLSASSIIRGLSGS
ncbi:MarR family transcriptional regulator [Mesorhizobium sp. BR1-1-16]|uniref:MarR family winged helix-turn-helix transcriptional regulator n=1 Tax=Mesorhizobium sp. BR1-1-16 TaxID=2876653 RepID=UPI001CCC8A33|nr:MarR family transcriptional regulator [Mesorhizobium sp. BR1-1-16]MBZ9936862.1 MarR family transcriptional regulator [Mesorhizobium sp. BR1-1-16]